MNLLHRYTHTPGRKQDGRRRKGISIFSNNHYMGLTLQVKEKLFYLKEN